MKNVRCEIWDEDDLIKVYRGDLFIAVVTDIYQSGDPTISFVNEDKEINKLTFNDFAIIQDNWNQMYKMKQDKLHIENASDCLCGYCALV